MAPPRRGSEAEIRKALELALAAEQDYEQHQADYLRASKAYFEAGTTRKAATERAVRALGSAEGVVIHHGYAWHVERGQLVRLPLRQDVSTQEPLLAPEAVAHGR